MHAFFQFFLSTLYSLANLKGIHFMGFCLASTAESRLA